VTSTVVIQVTKTALNFKGQGYGHYQLISLP